MNKKIITIIMNDVLILMYDMIIYDDNDGDAMLDDDDDRYPNLLCEKNFAIAILRKHRVRASDQ